MKLFYTALTLFCLAGTYVAYLIKPSQSEIALMYFQDKHYGLALQTYKKILAEGKYSPQTVNTLIKINLTKGNVDESIKLLEVYIQKNPKSIIAKKELARLYNQSQKPHKYMAILESIVEEEPTTENLKKLLSIYSDYGLLDKEVDILLKLVEDKNTILSEIDYKTLIIYYARREEFKKATLYAEQFLEERKYDVSADFMELVLSISVDSKVDSKILTFSRKFISYDPDQRIKFIVLTLVDDGRDDLAEQILNEAIEKYYPNPEDKKKYFYTKIELLIDLGKEYQAFLLLKERFNDGGITEKERNILLSLAIHNNDLNTIQLILEGLKKDVIPTKNCMELIEYAVLKKDLQILDELKRTLSETYLKKNKIISMLLKFAYNDKKALSFIFGNDLSSSEKLSLFKICVGKGRKELAFKIMQKIPVKELLDNIDPSLIASLMIDYGDIKKDIDKYKYYSNSHTHVSREATMVTLYLYAGVGDLINIKKLLNKKSLGVDEVAEFFFIAMKYQNMGTATFLANYIFENYSDDDVVIDVCEQLVSLEKYDMVLKPLEPFFSINPRAFSIYISSLSWLANNNPKLYKREKYRLKVIHTLFRTNKLDRGGLRDYGYFLVETGDRTTAKAIFRDLALQSKTLNNDIKEYISLLDIPLNTDEVQWLVKNINITHRNNLSFWADTFIEKGLYSELIAFAENKKLIDDALVLPYYMFSLYSLGKTKELSNMIGSLTPEVYQHLSTKGTVILVSIYNKLNKVKLIKQLLKFVPYKKLLLKEDYLDIVQLFIKTDEQQLGLKLLKSMVGKKIYSSEEKLSRAWVMLAVSAGEADAVEDWLSNAVKPDLNFLKDTYYLAEKNSQFKISLSIAELLYSKQKSSETVEIYLYSLLKNKRYDTAIKVIKDNNILDLSLSETILLTISESISLGDIQPDKEIKKKFKQVVDNLYAHNNVTEQLENDIAYTAILIGEYSLAKKIYLKLAKGKRIVSDEVQNLLFLSKKSFDPKVKLFIINLAKSAPEVDIRNWVLTFIDLKLFDVAETLIPQEQKFSNKFIDLSLFLMMKLNKQEKLATELKRISPSTIETLTVEQKAYIINILLENGSNEMAKNIFMEIPLEKALNKIAPYELAVLLKKTERLQLAYKKLKELPNKSYDGIVLQCYVMAYLNKRDELIELLKHKEISETEFENLYYLALELKHYPMLLTISELFVRKYPANKAKLLVAESHSYLGHYEASFRIMDKLQLNTTREKFEYLLTLANVIKNQKIKLDETNKTKAFKLINEVYFKLDKSHLSDLAYILIELGEVDQAKTILFDLAKDKKPTAQIVKDLIYIAGKKKWMKLREWLKSRAIKSSSKEEKILWLKYLNETGNSDIAIDILEDGK